MTRTSRSPPRCSGIISFLSPSVLPLVPPYSSISPRDHRACASDEEQQASKRAVMLSALLFVLGFLPCSCCSAPAPDRRPDPPWSAQLSLVAGIAIIVMGCTPRPDAIAS